MGGIVCGVESPLVCCHYNFVARSVFTDSLSLVTKSSRQQRRIHRVLLPLHLQVLPDKDLLMVYHPMDAQHQFHFAIQVQCHLDLAVLHNQFVQDHSLHLNKGVRGRDHQVVSCISQVLQDQEDHRDLLDLLAPTVLVL